MAAGGVIPSVFDQRPGVLEATRGLPAGGVFVAGARQCGAAGEAWGVLVTVRGRDGSIVQDCLTAEQARSLAAELEQMADIIEGRRW